LNAPTKTYDFIKEIMNRLVTMVDEEMRIMGMVIRLRTGCL